MYQKIGQLILAILVIIVILTALPFVAKIIQGL